MKQKHTVAEFIGWLYHDLLDYLCSRHRATLHPAVSGVGRTRGGAIARGRWQPLAKSASAVFDWRRLTILRYVDRRVIEMLAISAVLFPLMGYYFSVAVPAVMKFWQARF